MPKKREPTRRPRLTGERAPAQQSPAAEHEDALAPGKTLRDQAQSSRTERIGNGTPAGGPLTSPPVQPDD
jgi:hypothetical protein